MYPCKWNHASSGKNVNCWSISPLTTDCRNQLQKWTLLAESRGCKACVDYSCSIWSMIQSLCCPPCTRLLTFESLELDVSVIFQVYVQVWLPCYLTFPQKALGAYVFLSWLLRGPLIWIYSPNCELFVCWELFHHEIYVEIFADTS
jgi:hypothetical protein